MKVLGNIDVLYRYEIDTLKSEGSKLTESTHDMLGMRELLGHFKAPDNVSMNVSIKIYAPDSRTCCQWMYHVWLE